MRYHTHPDYILYLKDKRKKQAFIISVAIVLLLPLAMRELDGQALFLLYMGLLAGVIFALTDHKQFQQKITQLKETWIEVDDEWLTCGFPAGKQSFRRTHFRKLEMIPGTWPTLKIQLSDNGGVAVQGIAEIEEIGRRLMNDSAGPFA